MITTDGSRWALAWFNMLEESILSVGAPRTGTQLRIRGTRCFVAPSRVRLHRRPVIDHVTSDIDGLQPAHGDGASQRSGATPPDSGVPHGSTTVTSVCNLRD